MPTDPRSTVATLETVDPPTFHLLPTGTEMRLAYIDADSHSSGDPIIIIIIIIITIILLFYYHYYYYYFIIIIILFRPLAQSQRLENCKLGFNF